VTVTDQYNDDTNVKTEVDEVTGEEVVLVTRETSASRSSRIHVLPKFGLHTAYFDGIFGFGISFAAGPGAEDSPVLPAMMYELRAGQLGVAGYYGRGELITLQPTDWSMAHGVTFGGADMPSGHVAARFSQFVHGDAPMTWIEAGFASPRHWVVRPAIRAGIAPHGDPNLISFDVHGEVSVVLGKRRPKYSEQWGAPLAVPEVYGDGEEEWAY